MPRESQFRMLFGVILVGRLAYPFCNSPLHHLFSDPLRHWQTGIDFLHPDVMGGADPFLYQLWLFLVRNASGGSPVLIDALVGVLCAAMPYGWYRTLRELVGREEALLGACVVGLVPGFIGVYAYFMTETLLLTLTGFSFWFTLRAARKRTVGAFAVAGALWLAAVQTRIVVLPMAGLCCGWLWFSQPQKLAKAAVVSVFAILVTLAAGLHARPALGYFAPLGNLYSNEIYHDSGRKDIAIDFGAQGRYGFGCPSYYNPTFFPFSNWTTSRTGTVSIRVDTRRGRQDWVSEAQRVRVERVWSPWQDRWENLLYLAFGQEWPDNDRGTLVGWLTVWSRWLWFPVTIAVAYCVVTRLYSGPQWLLPICGLSLAGLLALQSEGIMEGRFRKPVEPVLLASLVLVLGRKSKRAAVP